MTIHACTIELEEQLVLSGWERKNYGVKFYWPGKMPRA